MPASTLIPKYFCRRAICARISKTQPNPQRILVFFPGGPCISGRYLDQFATALGKRTNSQVLVVDLPNHDRSRKKKIAGYSVVRKDLLRFLKEVAATYKLPMTLVGHSLGGLIAMDLLCFFRGNVEGLLLLNVPTKDEASPLFRKQADEIKSAFQGKGTSASFHGIWSKLIPLYFYRGPSLRHFRILAKETFLKGNERFSHGLPSYSKLARLFRLRPKSKIQKPLAVFCLEGANDLRVPEINSKTIRRLLPQARLKVLVKTGHFPMRESVQKTMDWAVKAVGSIT